MVNDAGQLYTMEGIAAAIIMILTAYIIVSTASIYTPGDTHITDMQLEQLGSDVLAMMDTPKKAGETSDLVKYVENIGNLDYNINGEKFKDMFLRYCNTTSEGTDDNLKMHAFVYYRKGDAILNKTLEDTDLSTGRDNAVRVTRFVYLPGGSSDDGSSGDQIVLVEVLLWRE